MRFANFRKLTVLVAVSLCTAWVTSRVVGQSRNSKRKQAQSQTASKPVLDTAAIASQPKSVAEFFKPMSPIAEQARALEAGPAANSLVLPDTFVSSGGVDGVLHVTAEDGEVNVSLASRLIESNPTISFLWSLRVFDDSRNPRLLSEHYYEGQMFKVALRQQTSQTFRESFALAPGAYKVQVTLHRLPDGFDLTKLRDKDVWRDNAVISVAGKVNVSP